MPNNGYLVVDKKGILKHVSYALRIVDWNPKVEVKGNGPYRLDVFEYGWYY